MKDRSYAEFETTYEGACNNIINELEKPTCTIWYEKCGIYGKWR